MVAHGCSQQVTSHGELASASIDSRVVVTIVPWVAVGTEEVLAGSLVPRKTRSTTHLSATVGRWIIEVVL